MRKNGHYLVNDHLRFLSIELTFFNISHIKLKLKINQKSNIKPLFPTAFHSLIHSPGNALEVLLQLENTYSQAISQIVLGEKKALELLQQK